MSAACSRSSLVRSSARCCLWTSFSTSSCFGIAWRSTRLSTTLCFCRSSCTSCRFCCRSSTSSRAGAFMANDSWYLRVAHTAGDGDDATLEVRRQAPPVVALGAGQDRREPQCLLRPERGCRHAEVVARRRLGAEDALAPFGHVQIELEDAAL